jgi:hypothetical protein
MEQEIELLKAKIKVLELELEILKMKQNIPMYPQYPVYPVYPNPTIPYNPNPIWYEYKITCGNKNADPLSFGVMC